MDSNFYVESYLWAKSKYLDPIRPEAEESNSISVCEKDKVILINQHMLRLSWKR